MYAPTTAMGRAPLAALERFSRRRVDLTAGRLARSCAQAMSSPRCIPGRSDGQAGAAAKAGMTSEAISAVSHATPTNFRIHQVPNGNSTWATPAR